MIACIIGMLVAVVICALHYLINEKPYEGKPLDPPKPFVLSEYYARMEQAALDIAEHQEPVDKEIILWWGFDGLRMGKDGELEWISRKKPNLSMQNVYYQPCQLLADVPHHSMAQSIQATQDTLSSIRAQLAMTNINMAQQRQIQNINSMLQSCAVPLPGYMGYNPQYQLTQCCCNWMGIGL